MDVGETKPHWPLLDALATLGLGNCDTDISFLERSLWYICIVDELYEIYEKFYEVYFSRENVPTQVGKMKSTQMVEMKSTQVGKMKSIQVGKTKSTQVEKMKSTQEGEISKKSTPVTNVGVECVEAMC